MQYFRQPYKQLTSQQLLAKGQMLIKARTMKDISSVLMLDEQWLRDQASNPQYYSFQSPKSNGTFRLIENPHPKLKDCQRLLADLLQGVYYGIRPRSAYAYIPNTSDETSPANIYTNALRHCNSKWVLQLDIKEFFHSISIQRVRELFIAMPFDFPDDTANVLARLVTTKNRVPMGAPTSPVISNLVCIELDTQLEKLARENGWTYTRFADDITFSAARRFSNDHIELIRQHIEGHGFVLNYGKTTQARIEDEPQVCGLALKAGGKPDLSDVFVKDLKNDIKTYRNLTSDGMIAQEIFSAEALNRFRQHIEGELAFVRFVKGPNNGLYLKFRFMLGDGMLGHED